MTNKKEHNDEIFKLSDRQKIILDMIIQDFILKGVPVGSRALSKRYPTSISPATIRNTMADLEEMELIEQPYTSAGRIPTEKGYRYYIDTLLSPKSLNSSERKLIVNELNNNVNNIKFTMHEVTRILSKISHHIGLLITPEYKNVNLKHIELIKLNNRQILMILITENGLIKNEIIDFDKNIRYQNNILHKVSDIINSNLKSNTLNTMIKILPQLLKKNIGDIDMLINKLNTAFEKEIIFGNENVYIEGISNIFRYPEFCDFEKLKLLIGKIERRETILDIFKKLHHSDKNVNVYIGNELDISTFSECSIIASKYSLGNGIFGFLGLIGPKRMKYDKMIPLVNYVSKTLTDIYD